MKRWLPTRAQLRDSRWLRPVAHHLEDDRLWHMDRGSVARGVAIGLFFGFLIPVAQFLFAIVTAIMMRANVAIAAASTLVSNPLTFPPIYWAAYMMGRFILGEPEDEAGAARIESETEALLAQQGFIEGIWTSMQAAGAPLIVGLTVFAVVSSAFGFLLVWLLWRPRHHHDGDDAARG